MNELGHVRKEELTERDIKARYRAVLQQIEDGPISAENAAANENMLAALEEMARRSGLVSETAQVELWLTRFLNRWRLGEALRKAMRGAGPGRGKKGVSNDTSFRKLLRDLGIKNPTEANNVQRLACMPWKNTLAFPVRVVAMLLTVDFDSGRTRTDLFRDNRRFAGKIVLLDRIVWFERPGAAPSTNHAWFIWEGRQRFARIQYAGKAA